MIDKLDNLLGFENHNYKEIKKALTAAIECKRKAKS